MGSKLKQLLLSTIAVWTLLINPITARAADEAQSVEELRDTVINLLNQLVKSGVLTKEQAQAMVNDARAKAAAQAKAQAEQEKAEQGAVRVPYVPEIVKDQIKEEVAQEVRPEVTQDVIAQARAEKWGVPGALPDWITNLNVHGDIRLRGEADRLPDVSPSACNSDLIIKTSRHRQMRRSDPTARIITSRSTRRTCATMPRATAICRG
jgi:Putative porin